MGGESERHVRQRQEQTKTAAPLLDPEIEKHMLIFFKNKPADAEKGAHDTGFQGEHVLLCWFSLLQTEFVGQLLCV